MNKKQYIIPSIQATEVAFQLMIANSPFSGKGTQDGDPVVGNGDDSDDDNRIKDFWYFEW